MKKIALLLWLTATCLASVAQQSVSLYPYKMDPRKHPDYLRHYVRAPDASVFGNKMQFISLRDLSGDYVSKLDLWIDKDQLGNILWVSYPLIFQDNLKEVVAEIKKRNLFLFDLWGFVPGSGPGGYWRQFRIPDGTLNFFETELGDKWLGMDNGEQDGRYVGAYAPQMVPIGDSRLNQYFNFQRHFEEMGNQLGNKMATLVSLNFGHYFLKEGVYTLIGAETAQGLPNSQIYYSFIRGAGKQYGVQWFGNASVWNRWGYKTYSDDATNIDDDYGSGGPLKGTSLSLLKRLMYNHIMYNCVAAGFEGSMRDSKNNLSPIGKIQQESIKWYEKYGDPGTMYTPVALMVDFLSGWSFPRHLYSSQAYKVWGNLPYNSGDYLMDGMLDVLYPGYQDASYFHDERGFITPTPYGDIADCLMSDAPEWVLQQYPLLVIADELCPNRELNDKLNDYIKSGGHLVITAGSLKQMKEGLAGIKVSGEMISCIQPISYKDSIIEEASPFNLLGLTYPTVNTKIIQTCGKVPAAIETRYGNGKITVIASPFGISEVVQCDLPVIVEEEKYLAKPYPLLKHVRLLMNDIYSDYELFNANPELSVVTCSRSRDEYTVLISNGSWEEKSFVIENKIGKIKSIKELFINTDERKAVGFTPKIVKSELGVNGKNKIAGGDVRIFRIKISDSNIFEKSEVLPTPNKTNRALTLRNINSIKEEVLSRPTFFEHYDRVIVDWRYLYDRDSLCLKNESGWFFRQKLGLSVDLTSGLNLFPDLRIVNNDTVCYEKSMAVMKNVIDKMTFIGADVLLISSQRMIENNFTKEQFHASLIETFQKLADYAANKNIRVVLRESVKRVPYKTEDAAQIIKDVNRHNFTYGPLLSLILENTTIDKTVEILKSMDVKDIFICAPERDIHDQLFNVNGPIYKYSIKENVFKVLSSFPHVNLVFDGLYQSCDEEYLDSKFIDNIFK